MQRTAVYMEILKWIHGQDQIFIQKCTLFGGTVMHYAAYNGHLEVMEWLHQQNPRLFLRSSGVGKTPCTKPLEMGS